MKPLRILVDVGDLAGQAGPDGHFRRVVGMLDDDMTVVVARMVAGEDTVQHELSFSLADGLHLAERALAGDRRALTTPGLARTLSATAAILFRVSLSAGAIQQLGDFYERSDGDPRDRAEAHGDEHLES